nr:lytic transglycosylase domain-containing protein [uncultured Lichenicoccus sp.]
MRTLLLPGLACLLTACAVHGALSQSQATPPETPQQAATLQRAQAQAARSADPIDAAVATWLRLQLPAGGSATEIDHFLAAHPDWPGRALLGQRLQEALAAEPDDAVARGLCTTHRPMLPATLLRCALALGGPATTLPPGASVGAAGAPGQVMPPTLANLPASIVAAARADWAEGLDDAVQEAEFLRLFPIVPGPAEQWRRFDRQEWGGALAAAQRQIPRLPANLRPLAVDRLALHRGDADAEGLAASLHGDAAHDPALLLDRARWLRRHDQDDAALALWHADAAAAEQAAPAARRMAYWTERDALARDLLAAHRDTDALYLADDSIQDALAARVDVDFLVGWIELRRLHDPAAAAPRFAALTTSRSVITTSRGFYWLGRAMDAAWHPADAGTAYAQAARHPTSFYGQAALAKADGGHADSLPAALAALHDPAWSTGDAVAYAGQDLARAAAFLVACRDPHHARLFLLRLDQTTTTETGHALGAGFAIRLGLPDVAVAIARASGRQGLVLPATGWPMPYVPPASASLPPGLALAVMRQESSFDPAIVSPAGAIGLMQLMPATARQVSGGAVGADALGDPVLNMQTGTTYLSSLLQRFGGREPYAIAAYNAGPNRVQQWIATTGPGADGSATSEATIDWIEQIPFAETRNYVQRVLESKAVYRQRSAGGAAARIAMVSQVPTH